MKQGARGLSDRQRLKLIDGLCLCYYDGKETLECAERILDNIYRVAHPHRKCPHSDWDKENIKLAKDLKKWGIVDALK